MPGRERRRWPPLRGEQMRCPASDVAALGDVSLGVDAGHAAPVSALARVAAKALSSVRRKMQEMIGDLVVIFEELVGHVVQLCERDPARGLRVVGARDLRQAARVAR